MTKVALSCTDDGHSFDQVLFFGHETTLTIFEILLFTVIDILSQNFILAAVITFVFMEVRIYIWV